MIGKKNPPNPLSENLTIEMEAFNHEFKSPITTIKIFAEILQRQINKLHQTDLNDNLNKIISKVDDLNYLIDDYSDIIRIRSSNFNFNDKFYLSHRLIHNIFKKIKTNFPDTNIKKSDIDNKKIRIDKNRFYQAVEKTILYFQKVYPDQQILIQLKSNSRFLIFNFNIKDEDILEFFNPYSISKNNFNLYTAKEDLRIGLVLASEIIKHSNGQFLMLYKKDKKLVCCFTLPFIG